MSGSRTFDLQIAEAQLLADLSSRHIDLLSVERWCDRFEKEAAKGERFDTELLIAFCTAALVRYGRAFGGGQRVSMPQEVLESLSPEMRVAHQRFIDCRDKWIAHSVNAFEESHIVLTVRLDPENRGLVEITEELHAVAALRNDEMMQLKLLAKTINRALGPIIKKERDAVRAFASNLSVDVLERLPQRQAHSGTENPGRARSRWSALTKRSSGRDESA